MPTGVLGPVPVLLPAIVGSLAGRATAMPWRWLLILGAMNTALLIVVVRRRQALAAA